MSAPDGEEVRVNFAAFPGVSTSLIVQIASSGNGTGFGSLSAALLNCAAGWPEPAPAETSIALCCSAMTGGLFRKLAGSTGVWTVAGDACATFIGGAELSIGTVARIAFKLTLLSVESWISLAQATRFGLSTRTRCEPPVNFNVEGVFPTNLSST